MKNAWILIGLFLVGNVGAADLSLNSFETTAEVGDWTADSGVARVRSNSKKTDGTYSMEVAVQASPWNGVNRVFSSIGDWKSRANLEMDIIGGSETDHLSVMLIFPGLYSFQYRVPKVANGEVRHIVIPIGEMDQMRSATSLTLRVYYSSTQSATTFYIDNIRLTGDGAVARKLKKLQSIVLSKESGITALGNSTLNTQLSNLKASISSLVSGGSPSEPQYQTQLATWSSLLSSWSTVVLQNRGFTSPEYTIGIESGMHKVKKADPLGLLNGSLSGTTIELSTARNEYENAQLIIAPLTKNITNVQVSATNLTGPGGAVLPSQNVQVRLVGEVDISGTTLAETQSLTGLWPDPLLEYSTVASVALGQTQPFWITVYAPAGQAPGLYTGSLNVTTGNSHSYPVTLKINVANFTLPKRSFLKTHFSLHAWPLTKFYETVSKPDFPGLLGYVDDWDFEDVSSSILNQWVDYAAKYRLSVGGPYGWGEYDPRVQPVMWPVTGTSSFDFSQWNTMMARGINQGANAMSVIGASKMPGRASDPNFVALASAFLPAMEVNLQAKGWTNLAYLYLPDEPGWPILGTDFLSMAQLFKSLAPSIKTLVTTMPPAVHPDYLDIVESVDVFVPLFDSCDPTVNAELQQQGKEVWWYTCLLPYNPYPHLGVYQDGVDPRIIPWMTWKFKLDGLLYWGLDVFPDINIYATTTPKWPATPWSMQGFPYSPGDGMLMYPGPNGKPWSSIRLENLRDGIEDYDYMALLSKGVKYLEGFSRPADLEVVKGQAQGLLDMSGTVSTPINFTRSTADILAYRQNVMNVLSQMALPNLAYIDDFSDATPVAWNPLPPSAWSSIDDEYRADSGNSLAYAMRPDSPIGSSWKIEDDIKWIRSNYSSNNGYGVAGILLSDSATSPMNGNYFHAFISRSAYTSTQNFIAPAAEWRINGVTGTSYPAAGIETTGFNEYRLSVERAPGSNDIVVKVMANGLPTQTLTVPGLNSGGLNALTYRGMTNYFSVTRHDLRENYAGGMSTWNTYPTGAWTPVSKRYRANAGGNTIVSMLRDANIGNDWQIDHDIRWISSNHAPDPGYGVSGIILANSSSDPQGGDYFKAFVARSKYDATRNYVRPIAEWRINGVSGSNFHPASLETTGENNYHLTVQRITGTNNVTVAIIANGLPTMSFTVTSISSSKLDSLQNVGLMDYLSVSEHDNILVTHPSP